MEQYPIPFPLASGRYETGPAMRRFGQAGQGFPAEEGHFQPDAGLAAALSAKLSVLRQAPHEVHLIADGLTPGQEEGLRTALQESFGLIAAEHPSMVSITEDGAALHHLGLRLSNGWRTLEQIGEPWPELSAVAAEAREYLAGQTGLQLLGNALALSAQEDLAIVRGSSDDSPADVLEWLHVCLPSSWVPAEKVGRSFVAVHGPVAHHEQLVAAQARIIRAMIDAGPFVRYVWGIHRDGELCHNPRIHTPPPWVPEASPEELARQAWFRVERQTTHGFPALNRALFTIRYWVEPLVEVAADPYRRERLASALAGMDAESLSYKGLAPARDRLLAWLVS